MAYSLRVTVTRPVYEHMAPQALQYGLIPELLASLDWQAGRAGGGAAAGGAGAAGSAGSGVGGGGGEDEDAAVLRVLAVDAPRPVPALGGGSWGQRGGPPHGAGDRQVRAAAAGGAGAVAAGRRQDTLDRCRGVAEDRLRRGEGSKLYTEGRGGEGTTGFTVAGGPCWA